MASLARKERAAELEWDRGRIQFVLNFKGDH